MGQCLCMLTLILNTILVHLCSQGIKSLFCLSESESPLAYLAHVKACHCMSHLQYRAFLVNFFVTILSSLRQQLIRRKENNTSLDHYQHRDWIFFSITPYSLKSKITIAHWFTKGTKIVRLAKWMLAFKIVYISCKMNVY